MKFNNPILRGFNPDPCLCRKGNNFYIATSTFEWYPGVRIYHSRNLREWTLIAEPLTTPEFINLSMIPSSGGIWAPDLSYNPADSHFYLVYTIVTNFEKASKRDQGFKDCHNFVTKAKKITGPWSTPTYIDSKGFDPSIFHDDSGKSYYISMLWNYRCGENNFAGISMHEFNCKSMKLGQSYGIISHGTQLGTTEGPHLYKRKGWYYLVMAEGGTSYLHSVTIQRSRLITGPYENHPKLPFLSQAINREAIRKNPESALKFCNYGLQKTGHASFCMIDENIWLMAFLCSRPEKETTRCPLGRETALTTVIWNNEDWPILDEDAAYNICPNLKIKKEEQIYDFTRKIISNEIQSLRNDISHHLNMENGYLEIQGGESPASRNQILLGIRITEHKWATETQLHFIPRNFLQMAGLSIRYSENLQYYLAISKNFNGQYVIGVHSFIGGLYSSQEKILPDIAVYGWIKLKAICDGRWISFFYETEKDDWEKVGGKYDFTLLSDECFKPIGFTGSFVGITCNDMEKHEEKANFKFLSYSTLP